MKTVKLSECTKPGQVFIYNYNTVSLQYILKKIYAGELNHEVRIYEDNDAFDNAVASILKQSFEDMRNGIKKEEYPIGDLKTILVDIDITKENIRHVDEYKLNFEVIK